MHHEPVTPVDVTLEEVMWLEGKDASERAFAKHDGAIKSGWPSDPDDGSKCTKLMRLSTTLGWLDRASGIDSDMHKKYYHHVMDQFEEHVPREMVMIVDFVHIDPVAHFATHSYKNATGYFKFNKLCTAFLFYQDRSALNHMDDDVDQILNQRTGGTSEKKEEADDAKEVDGEAVKRPRSDSPQNHQ